jgi:hypothetical protein
VRIDILTPPVAEGQAEHRSAVAIQVSQLANTEYALTIDGIDYAVTSSEEPATNEVRDALIEAINASEADVTAGALRDDVLVLEPWTNDIAVGSNLVQKLARYALCNAIITFSVDAYSSDDSAVAIAKRIELGLDNEVAMETLRAGGWSTASVEGVRKPDAISGGAWETRAGFDMRLRCCTRTVELIPYLEHVEPIGVGVVAAFA